MGDLARLADSIREHGLLQAIGITEDDELVFGARRLRACRDILGHTEIDVRVVAVAEIASGEYAENEIRKDFTPSERVAIRQTIERKKRGGDRGLGQERDRVNRDEAARLAGFSNRETARRAALVVDKGVPELVEAMDRGEIGIEPAAAIARLDADGQRKIVSLPAQDRRAEVGKLRGANRPGQRIHKITIPYSAKQAARILAEKWQPSLCRELIEALQERLAKADKPTSP